MSKFKKGLTPWNKGKKLTKKHRDNISKSKKGKSMKHSKQFKRGRTPWNDGIKIDRTQYPKMGHFQKHTLKQRINCSLGHTKEKEFTGFKQSIYRRLKNSNEWKTWREQVFKRDNYTCQNSNCKYCNNQRGKAYLHPHHIVPVTECMALDYKELVYDMDNGITYCEDYHLKSDLHQGGG